MYCFPVWHFWGVWGDICFCKKIKKSRGCFSIVSRDDCWPINIRNRSGSPFVSALMSRSTFQSGLVLPGLLWNVFKQIKLQVNNPQDLYSQWLICWCAFPNYSFTYLCAINLCMSESVLKMKLRRSQKFWKISYQYRLRDSGLYVCSPEKRGRQRRKTSAVRKEMKGTNISTHDVTI